MKYDNEHAEYLFDGASSGAVSGDGDVAAPSGWFAEIHLMPGEGTAKEDAAFAFYGTRFLIIQEDSDGNTYVHPFPDQAALNERLLILERAWRTWETGLTDDQVVAAHRGFTREMAGAIGMPGLETEWSVDAQRETREIVTDWLIENHDDVNTYMTLPYTGAYARDRASWEDVGIDLAHVIQRQGFAFTDAVGAHECAAEMNRAALHIPPLALAVVGGIIEVVK